MINPYRQICTWLEPELVAKELIKQWGEAGLIWLDGDGSKLGRHVTLGVNPSEQICCAGLPSELNASNPFEALRELEGRSFEHTWELEEALSKISSDWIIKGGIENKLNDRKIKQKLAYICRIFERS